MTAQTMHRLCEAADKQEQPPPLPARARAHAGENAMPLQCRAFAGPPPRVSLVCTRQRFATCCQFFLHVAYSDA